MLPHIFHSTTRAAATVHNPTQALRNVLQLQSSGPSSSGSNSSRGNGPSSGGPKFNTGSRFHANYNNAGRAVTQANVVTSYDSSGLQPDDTEDFAPRRPVLPTPQKRQRFRSSSVSLTTPGRVEQDGKLGVLKTVQIHARAHHAFAPAETLALAKQRLLAEALPRSLESEQARAPLLIRRNSTSTPLSPLMSPALAPAPLPAPESLVTPVEQQTHPAVDPSDPQTVNPPDIPKRYRDTILKRFAEISDIGDYKSAIDYVRFMVNQCKDLDIEHFNAAFTTLLSTRAKGEPLNAIIRLYNSMLEKSVVPNVKTYETLILALTTRDFEIQRAILILDQRLKHVAFLSQDEVSILEADKNRIEKLKMEDNFPSAMSLFEGILSIDGKNLLHMTTYIRLLRSCAYHSDVSSALHVFAQLETSKHLRLNHLVFQNLILTFMNARRVEQCEEIFNAYLSACKEGRLGQHKGSTAEGGRYNQTQVWNIMIEAYFRFDMPDKAVALVQQMVSSPATNFFSMDEIPVPTSSTFTTVIAGFILSGDVKSALTWFDRLLLQEKAPMNPFQGLDGKAMRPNSVAWQMMLDALAREGMIDDLNRLYRLLKDTHKEDYINIRPVDRYIIHRANLDNLEKVSNEQALETLGWLVEEFTHPSVVHIANRWNFIMDICVEYVKRGEYGIPFDVLTTFITGKMDHIAVQPFDFQQLELQHTYLTVCEALYLNLQQGTKELPWHPGWTAMRLGIMLGLKPQSRFAPYIIPGFSRARYFGEIAYDDVRLKDWDVILRFSAYLETNAARGNPDNLPLIRDDFNLGRVGSVLQDMASHGVDFGFFAADIKVEVMQVLEREYGGEQGRTAFLNKLGSSYAEAAKNADMLKFGALEEGLSQPASPLLQAEPTSLSASPSYPSSFEASEAASVSSYSSSPSPSGLVIHSLLTRTLVDLLDAGPNHKPKVAQAYRLFEKNLSNRLVPEPGAFAKLIQAFGRMGDLEKVRGLYTVAQDMFPLLNPAAQLNAWAFIEDSMIIALAHAGFPESAHVHRMRILDQGLTPSADAYGVLIQHVKDTTDDTSGAMALFKEAAERLVMMNLYLYNNIISKLSKARKADYALELFQQMKASNILPSSITYGAVIGACARVGDVKSAELLFQEMVHSRNFKPRVPPYNTMMQLHTTTKPNRTSALHYYDEMKKAGVQPSSHTYKLLIDTYGTIEPIDLPAMENAFHELQDDMAVELTGAHFASLINAYGCSARNFDKAISVFESMHTVPRAPAPDAVVFEAVINVIVAHKRTELLPVYVEKMHQSNVHMTAYIANFLIKGYANIGDLARAREIFESLVDPPCGIAAPNNHTPHHAGVEPEVGITDLVYREPSTWEVMVRAELGIKNEQGALILLERLKERGFPEAVYNRISGILTDHSAVV